MQVLGNKSRACPLNLVWAGFERLAGQALRNHRRILGLDGNRFEGRFARLNHLVTAGDGSPCADCGNQDIHPAVGVRPDFFGGGLAMDGRIGRVLELLGYP